MKKPIYAVFFILILTGMHSAHSASFDCSKAKSIPEYLICGTPELSKADDELDVLFKAARNKAQDKQAFREQARARFSEREKKCRDVPCLQQWYAQQKGFYSALLNSASSPQELNADSSETLNGKGMQPIDENTQSKLTFDCKKKDCPYFSDLYDASPEFRNALRNTVLNVHKQVPEWVSNGAEWPMTPISIGDAQATIGSVSEPHNLPHKITVIFFRDSQRLVGMFMEDETTGSWLGNPADHEKTILRTYNNNLGSFKIGQRFPGPVQSTVQAPKEQSSNTKSAGAAMPTDESTFISIVTAAQQGNQDAANDMQRGGVKAQREQQLCKSMRSLQASNWIGRIKEIDANSEGKGVLSVEVAKNIIVTTWNNSLSDLLHETLIEPGSPVFNVASELKKGQQVRFSGYFFRGEDGDCLFESSLTLRGKLREPEFIFRFSEISPI